MLMGLGGLSGSRPPAPVTPVLVPGIPTDWCWKIEAIDSGMFTLSWSPSCVMSVKATLSLALRAAASRCIDREGSR